MMKKVKLFAVILLSLILNSCNGQINNSDSQPTKSVKNLEDGKLNTKSNEYPFFSVFNNQISQVVRTIFQDSKGNLWFGTQNGAFKLYDNSLIHMDDIINEFGKDVTIKDITEGKDGKVWLAHTGGITCVDGDVISNYYESDGLISNDTWSITADNDGKIWIGTIKGICVFNGKKFTKFNLPEGKIDQTLGVSSTKIVHSIFKDSKGTLWFSSNAGLFSYANDSLINVSQKAGIKTNFVNEIFEDKSGTLWVSTKMGLFNLIDGKVENITDGRIETGKGIGSIAEDKNGTLWFVSNQHFLFTYHKGKLIEFKKNENNKGPVVFQIFKDQDDRLWFVGFGGAYRLENGQFINVTNNGPW